jgi:hypothetical protein
MNAQPPPPPPPPPPHGAPQPPPPLYAPPPHIPSSELRPSTVWFWVAGAVGVVCVVVSILLFVNVFSGLVDDLTGPLTELEAPGEVTLELEEGAERTIYRQFREAGAPVASGAPDPTCTVSSPSGSAVEVGDTFEWTLNRSGDRYRAIHDFSAPTAGAYTVSCETRDNSSERVPVAIGESIGLFELLAKAGAALALFFGGLIVAGTIAGVTGVMRSNHKTRLQRERAAKLAAAPPPASPGSSSS